MSSTRKVAAGMTAAALLGSGMAMAVPAQAAAPQVAPTVAPAEVIGKKKTPKKALKILQLNLYLGGSLNPAIEAIATGGDFYGAARTVYDSVEATNFRLRAKTIAKTVKKQKPDIVTLNELTTWAALKNPASPALKEFNYLKIMRKALRKEGLQFKVAAKNDPAKIPPFAGVGLPYANPDRGCPVPADLLQADCSFTFQMGNAILYNTKTKKLKPLKARAKGTFKRQLEFNLGPATISFERGWASRAFKFRGKPFTMMTAHLEVESGTEGTTGTENWPSPIQVAQGKQLVKAAKKQAKKTKGRVILAGDLNTDANGYYSPTYGNLTKYFKDSYLQAGGKKGESEGATCCHLGTLDSNTPLDSGDPVVPTRIDLVLTRKAKGVSAEVIENKFRNSQPIWQSDHYFYAAAVRLKK